MPYMPVDIEGIGLRIIKIRKELGYSQKILAEKANLGRSFISHIEAGSQKPSFDVIVKIIDKFNVSADWLLTGEGQMFVDENKVLSNMSEEHLQLMKKLLSKTEDNQKKIITAFENLLELD